MATANIYAAPLLHPFHGILLAFPVAFFPAAMIADITYLNSAEMQWTNFAAWLIAAATFFSGLVLAWALIGLLRRRARRGIVYAALVAAMFILGLVNSFKHSQDAWSSVGAFGLTLSILATIVALAAAWTGLSHRRGIA